MWRVATMLDSTDLEHCHHCRKVLLDNVDLGALLSSPKQNVEHPEFGMRFGWL